MHFMQLQFAAFHSLWLQLEDGILHALGPRKRAVKTPNVYRRAETSRVTDIHPGGACTAFWLVVPVGQGFQNGYQKWLQNGWRIRPEKNGYKKWLAKNGYILPTSIKPPSLPTVRTKLLKMSSNKKNSVMPWWAAIFGDKWNSNSYLLIVFSVCFYFVVIQYILIFGHGTLTLTNNIVSGGVELLWLVCICKRYSLVLITPP